MKLFRNRLFLALIAIILAAGICFGLAPAVNKAQNNQVQIVRAVKSIPEGTVSVGIFNPPANILKTPENVVGKYTTAKLDPGDYILSTKVSDKSQSPYLSNLDGKQQAISISNKSFAAGLSGKLQSDDIISLIVSNYGPAKQVVAPPELKYVKLLAATTAQGTDTDQVQKKDNSDTSNQSQNIPATLTLLVNTQQAQRLVDYETNGSLYATLVFRGAEDAARKYLDVQSSYFLTQESESASSSSPQTGNAPSGPTGTGGVPTNGK